jgi:hypothetical protein
MRWSLICGLGAAGILLAPCWFFAHVTLGPSWIYFAVALSFAAVISRSTTTRRFLHGFLVGLLFFAEFGTASVLLWTGAFAWARWSGGGMQNHLADGVHSVVELLVWLLIAGIVSGLLLGFLTWIWSRLDVRESARAVA